MDTKKASSLLYLLKMHLNGIENWVDEQKKIVDSLEEIILDVEEKKMEKNWRKQVNKVLDENKQI